MDGISNIFWEPDNSPGSKLYGTEPDEVTFGV